MSRHDKLETSRLILRPLEASDADRIIEFMSVREVTKFLLYFSYPINGEQVKAWLNSVLEAKPEYCAYWAIVDKETGILIGVISLTLDQYNHKGDIGYLMDKDYWGKGLMTEACWSVVSYGFGVLKLHRIDISHMVGNIGSQKVINKLGFQMEGCWREAHFKDGRFVDVKIYGMLEVDYVATKKRLGEAD